MSPVVLCTTPGIPRSGFFHPPHPTTKSTSLLYSIDRVESAEWRMKACCLVVADILLIIITVHTMSWDHRFSTQNGKDTPNPSLRDRKRYCPLHIFLFFLPSFKCICLIKCNMPSVVMRWQIDTPWSTSIQVYHDYAACERPKVERVILISVLFICANKTKQISPIFSSDLKHSAQRGATYAAPHMRAIHS